jgi:Zinc dependent phospholipase C
LPALAGQTLMASRARHARARNSHPRLAAAMAIALLAGPLAVPLAGYSVVSHEAVVDAAWDPVIKPLLLKIYPTASDAQLREAHAYAYGGCVIQDMGYYPFGNRLFTNLTHYARSGDFVSALFEQSQNMYDYAFALGALAHYAADIDGHTLAVNLSVPDTYPKLQRKFGKVVTYEDAPTAHLMVEFSFDVAQVAGSGYSPATYGDFIGFQVATPLLERAFQETYGLNLKDLFLSEDLAIGTYRRSASEIIPQMTEVAWKEKRKEILQANPNVTRSGFVYRLSVQDYRARWGKTYRQPRFQHTVWGRSEMQPGLLARFLVFLARFLPKVGPLRTLRFKPPQPETQALFISSFKSTVQRYTELVGAMPNAADPALQDDDLDTGKPARLGEYGLADKTYAELLHRLRTQKFAGLTPELQRNILSFFQETSVPNSIESDSREWQRVQTELAALRTAPATAYVAAPGTTPAKP